MTRLITAAAVLVMAVSGCSNAVAGTPLAGPATNEPLTAKRVLGEFSTINYCSLISAEALPRELGEVTAPAAAALDYCVLEVRVKGANIEGRVGYLEDYHTILEAERTDDEKRRPPHGLKVQRGTEAKELCARFLEFPDNVWLTVTANSFNDDSGSGGDPCPLADAMLDTVIDRVSTQSVRHFSWDEKSAAALNACDLVKPDIVAAKLGTRNAGALRFLSGHECRWFGPANDDPEVRLTFDVFSAPGVDSGTEESIAGRRTLVLSSHAELDEGESICLLETEHLKSTAFGRNELIALQVVLPGKGKDACGPARELAAEIWANLPTP